MTIKGLLFDLDGTLLDRDLISESEGLRKPDPKIFERALKKLNVMAEETIFVGDHPIHDVAASRAVGMQGWWKEDRVAKNDVWETSFIAPVLVLLAIITGRLIWGGRAQSSV